MSFVPRPLLLYQGFVIKMCHMCTDAYAILLINKGPMHFRDPYQDKNTNIWSLSILYCICIVIKCSETKGMKENKMTVKEGICFSVYFCNKALPQ